MKQIIFLFILLVNHISSFGQIYIVGDTFNKNLLNVDITLLDNDIELDIDCDSISDINFISHEGGKFYKDWPRLSFYMDSNTKVINNNIGFVTRYNVLDTIDLNLDIWTKNLDFIYGQGVIGTYGWINIDSDFIVFRKIVNTDTFFAFIEISSLATQLKFHKIISTCKAQFILPTLNEIPEKEIIVYPNPTNGLFKLNKNYNEIIVLDILGNKVRRFLKTDILDLTDLSNSIYFLNIKLENEIIKRIKIIKQ